MLDKLKGLLKLAIISFAGDDSKQVPEQQVSYNGKPCQSIAWYPYGFHAIADEDCFCVIGTIGANSEERVHLVTSMLKRPRGEKGEVFVYHPNTGNKIHFKNDGTVVLEATSDVTVITPTKVVLDAPDVEITGNLDVTGDVGVGGDVGVTGAVDLASTLTVLGNTTLTEEVVSGTEYIGGRHEHNRIGTGDDFTEGPVDNG